LTDFGIGQTDFKESKCQRVNAEQTNKCN